MDTLFSQLGINGKLLLAQGINFLIVLVVLRTFIYVPLLSTMKARREKIEKGLEDADEAKNKLAESELVKAEKISEGEKKAAGIVEEAGVIAKKHAKLILHEADLESQSIISEAELIGAKKIEEEKLKFEKQAKDLLKEAISVSVGMNPESVDKKLIEDALATISNKK